MNKNIILVILLCCTASGLPAIEFEAGLLASIDLSPELQFGGGGAFGLGTRVFTAGITVKAFPDTITGKVAPTERVDAAGWVYSGPAANAFVVGAYAIRRFFDSSVVGMAIIAEAGASINMQYTEYSDAEQRWFVYEKIAIDKPYIGGGLGIRILGVEVLALIDTELRVTLRVNVPFLDAEDLPTRRPRQTLLSRDSRNDTFCLP